MSLRACALTLAFRDTPLVMDSSLFFSKHSRVGPISVGLVVAEILAQEADVAGPLFIRKSCRVGPLDAKFN